MAQELVCKHCIMPDSFPGISFENGVCGLCRDQGRRPSETPDTGGPARLHELLTRGQTGAYPCAVPISGGKDGCYVLLYLVKELGIRPLALFFDSGFMVEPAPTNAEEICRQLKIDLVIGHAGVFRRRAVVEALKLSRSVGTFVQTCTGCSNNIRAFAIGEAIRHRVPYILWGSAEIEEGVRFQADPKAVPYRYRSGTWRDQVEMVRNGLSALLTRGASRAGMLAAPLHTARCAYYKLRDNLEMPLLGGWRRWNPLYVMPLDAWGPRSVRPFEYLDYNPMRMVDTLKLQVGWQAPVDRETRYDCRLHAFYNYRHLIETGLTRDGFTLALLVRRGLMQREEALRREEIICRRLVDECLEVGHELGVDLRGMLGTDRAESSRGQESRCRNGGA